MRIKFKNFWLLAWLIAGWLFLKTEAVYANCVCQDVNGCCGWSDDGVVSPGECELPGHVTNKDCKGDDGGCGPGNYLVRYEQKRTGEWGQPQCIPCWDSSFHGYQPTNVSVTHNKANNTLDVSWTPPYYDSLHQVGQVLYWTTNPNDLYRCNVKSSGNPCQQKLWEYSDPIVTSYSIPLGGGLTTRYYVRVETLAYATFWMDGPYLRKSSLVYDFEDCPTK